MTVSTRIATGGRRSLTRIAFPSAEMRECLRPDGKLDPVKAQLAFAIPPEDDYRPFQPASDDDAMVYFATMTFLENLHYAYEQVTNAKDADCDDHAVVRQDERNEKHMARNRFVFVRMRVQRRRADVRVRITVDNPYGVVGGDEAEAEEFAVTCAQIWMRIAREIKWLVLDFPPPIAVRAADAVRRTDDRRTYGQCARRVNGYCSPCKTDCKFFRNGKCEWREE